MQLVVRCELPPLHRVGEASPRQMAVIAELRVVAAIAAGRIGLIQGSYSDGCGILVSGDCSVTGFWRDALGAVPHLGEACVPLSVLSAYGCGSGWLPCWSVRGVREHQRGQPESTAGSCSNRLL